MKWDYKKNYYEIGLSHRTVEVRVRLFMHEDYHPTNPVPHSWFINNGILTERILHLIRCAILMRSSCMRSGTKQRDKHFCGCLYLHLSVVYES
jgi:hypothetical protein